MRAVIQRVSRAVVSVDGVTCAQIAAGLLILLGVSKTDSERQADILIAKILALRVFRDESGKMNRSVTDAGGSLLVVSNFTVYADCRKGNRPSFDLAASPDRARALYNYFVESARKRALPIETGVFQAHMSVSLENDGPVTVILDAE